jgi:hypothetical protein
MNYALIWAGFFGVFLLGFVIGYTVCELAGHL